MVRTVKKTGARGKRPRAAVLLMGYGAADSLAEVPAYLKNVLGGRAVPPPLLRDVTERYRRIGGKSPLKKITEKVRRALHKRLKAERPDIDIKVYAGMKNSGPTILSAVEEIVKDGYQDVVTIPLTPYYSKMSVGAYYGKLESALKRAGKGLQIHAIESWYEHPLLIDAFAKEVRDAYDSVPMQLRMETVLLLTGHSLPEKILKSADPYPDQLRSTAAAVATFARMDSWRFAYQSAGGSKEPWLGPDAAEVLGDLAATGCRSVLLAAIGFIGDHLETLYDIDIVYKEMAEKAGMHFTRAKALNDAPGLVETLADLALKELP